MLQSADPDRAFQQWSTLIVAAAQKVAHAIVNSIPERSFRAAG
jgi:hypothetical protein